MIWLVRALAAALAMAPLALSVRAEARATGRREAAIMLHRAQLAELDRDLAEGRIAPAEHANAVLEVQRRLLAAAGEQESPPPPGSRGPLIAALVMVPIAALALYITGGSPFLPDAPLAERIALAAKRAREDDALIARLRQELPRLDPGSEQARRGWLLLGNAEASRGNMSGAAQALGTALASRFDPALAMETAEAMTESAGHVTPEAAALFRRALATAPADAPWRVMAEKRLSEDAP